jgi:hypothetical protein
MWHGERLTPVSMKRMPVAIRLEVESKRVGSEDRGRQKKGTGEVKRLTLSKIPTAGILPSRFLFRFQGKKSFFGNPFPFGRIYFLGVS